MNCYMNIAQAEKILGAAHMEHTYMIQDALFIICQWFEKRIPKELRIM